MASVKGSEVAWKLTLLFSYQEVEKVIQRWKRLCYLHRTPKSEKPDFPVSLITSAFSRYKIGCPAFRLRRCVALGKYPLYLSHSM